MQSISFSMSYKLNVLISLFKRFQEHIVIGFKSLDSAYSGNLPSSSSISLRLKMQAVGPCLQDYIVQV